MESAGHMISLVRRLVLSVAVAVFALLVSCAGSDDETPPAARLEVHDFTGLSEMIAASDAVIEGTVLEVEPGRVVGTEDPIQFQQVTLRVDALLSGNVPTETVLLEESGGSTADAPGISKEGDHGIFFLTLKRGEGPYYALVNSEGRFIAQDGGLVASNDLDPWVQEIESLTLEELKEEIVNSAE